MELKDVILSTLAEIEEITTAPEPIEPPLFVKKDEPLSYRPEKVEIFPEPEPQVRDDEVRMLEGIRERLLVLFEGFQSPNNVQIEAKVDLTLNFFEYLLATIDNRLDTIKK